MKKHFSIIIAIVIVFISFMGIKVQAKNELTEKLKDNIITIKTTKAEEGFEDLMPLKDILMDKKIVGIGEATHGTADFFQMKHRMFQFLVKEMGYRIFVIEAQFGDGQIVNDYILNGNGTLEFSSKALKQFTVTSNETLDMIEWMKKFNNGVEEKDKIKFYGYDMQGIDGNLKQIIPYLIKVKSKATFDKKNLEGFLNPLYRPKDKELEKLNEDIANIYNDLIVNKDKYIKETSEKEYELILQNIEIINQWIDLSKVKDFNQMFDLRDNYAAKNIQWILNYENKYYENDKIMLWAHNGHIENHNSKVRLLEKDKKTLGENLKEIYKDDYYSIALDFYKGSFVANNPSKRLSTFNLKSSRKGSLAYEMMKTDIEIGFLDINKAKKDDILLEFLSSGIHMNYIGADYNGSVAENPKILKDVFDGIIFIETTKAAKFGENIILNDGNKSLRISNTIKLVGMILLLIVFFKIYKKRLPTIAKNEEYYFLDKIKEKEIKDNKIMDLIMKLSRYLKSLSSFKYNILAILALTVLSIVNMLLNPTKNSLGQYMGIAISLILIQLVIMTIVETLLLLISFILPLTILKKVSKERKIFLKQIFIASIIGAVVNTLINIFTINVVFKDVLFVENLSFLIYLLGIIIGFIEGLIICYSYALFSYKWEKPILNILAIVFFQEFIIGIISMLIFIVNLF